MTSEAEPISAGPTSDAVDAAVTVGARVAAAANEVIASIVADDGPRLKESLSARAPRELTALARSVSVRDQPIEWHPSKWRAGISKIADDGARDALS